MAKKTIFSVGVTDARVQSYKTYHDNAMLGIEANEKQISDKLSLMTKSGRMNEDVYEVILIARAASSEHKSTLLMIDRSARDYETLRTSRTFRFVSKIMDFIATVKEKVES